MVGFGYVSPLKYIHYSYVIVSTDNTIVVSFINKQRGPYSNLSVKVWKILQWCLNIILSSGFFISQANSVFW